MAAVAALPQSCFNRTLSQSRHPDDRLDLGEGPSSNPDIRPLHAALPSSPSLAPTPNGVHSAPSDARAQLLNPSLKPKPQTAQTNRGQIWKDALKTRIEFTPGQKFDLGMDISYEPINRRIHPGQGKGVLIGAMGPLVSQEEDDDDASTPDSSPPEIRPSKFIGPVRPAVDSPQEMEFAPEPTPSSSATPPLSPSIVTSWPRPQSIGPGFMNTGNTCFLNATLQALIYTPALAVGLLDRDEHPRDSCRLSKTRRFCALCHMYELLNICLRPRFNNSSRWIKPSQISNYMSQIAPLMRGHRQEDAHEFLRMLIEAMQNAALGGREKMAQQKDKEATFIYRMFAGKFRSRVTCQHCKATSDTFDTFLDLSLDIGQANSVPNALRQLKQLDYLQGSNQYKCEKCKQLRDAKKELSVCEAPPILTLHIKRFNARARKVNKRIQFNDTLDLRAAMGPDSPPTRYKLYAVVCHSGSNITSGHYYSYIKSSEHQWYECDDARTCQVKSNVVYGNQQEAYMFFYARDPEDMLEAAIQKNRTTTNFPSDVGNLRDSTWRKRRNSQSVANSSKSESSAREDLREPGKKAKVDNCQTPNVSSERSRIIGPLPNSSPSSSTTLAGSVPLRPISNTSYDTRVEGTVAPNEQVEDLGVSVPRSNLGSSVGHQNGQQQQQRKKPKHRALVNGDGQNRQSSYLPFNSVNGLRPKTIRG